MTLAVLDSSALLALLLAEEGSRQVAAALSDAAMSTVNLGEVVSVLSRRGVAETDIRQQIVPLQIDFAAFDDEQAYRTGALIEQTKSAGLSFGDRACLALAHKLGASVLTADRSWQKVAKAAAIKIDLIR